MNIRAIILAVVLGATITMTGCASIFNTGGYLSIMTNPPSAKVLIKGIDNGEKVTLTTPCTFQLNKKTEYQVSITLAGYQSENIMIRKGVSGWFWGNILLGGIIGMAIDYGTGNMYDFSPTNINIDLTKMSTLPETISGEFPITLIMENGAKEVKNLPITFHKI